jgi:DNA polymerase III subunit beta
MVARTQFAITSEDTRYFLNGALLVLTGDSMTLVATDGHRLALITVPREGGKDEGESRVILPEEDAARALEAAERAGGDIRYERARTTCSSTWAERLLISRMIDGQFPAYERVIPKGNDKRVEFERDRLTSAIRRVALLSNERSRAVKLAIDPARSTWRRAAPSSAKRTNCSRSTTTAPRCRSASTRSTCSISSGSWRPTAWRSS